MEFRYEQVSIYVVVNFPVHAVGSGGGGTGGRGYGGWGAGEYALLNVVLRRCPEFNNQLHSDYFE